MTDVWEYRDNVYNTGKKIMFPNFPFNDNRENTLVQTKKIKTKSDLDASLNLLCTESNNVSGTWVGESI